MNIKTLQKKLTILEEDDQPITSLDAAKAISFIEYMQLNTKEDYFLYFSSLNLLIKYSKDSCDKEILNYLNKNGSELITYPMDMVINNKIKGITFSNNEINDTTDQLLINVGGTQFSFNNVQLSETMKDAIALRSSKYKKEALYGINLANHAKTLFEKTYEELNNLSNKTKGKKYYSVGNIVQKLEEEYESRRIYKNNNQPINNCYELSN